MTSNAETEGTYMFTGWRIVAMGNLRILFRFEKLCDRRATASVLVLK